MKVVINIMHSMVQKWLKYKSAMQEERQKAQSRVPDKRSETASAAGVRIQDTARAGADQRQVVRPQQRAVANVIVVVHTGTLAGRGRDLGVEVGARAHAAAEVCAGRGSDGGAGVACEVAGAAGGRGALAGHEGWDVV